MELEKLLVNAGKIWPASKLSVALWRRGGKRKESLQPCLWNFNICIEKVDAKCWLAEMTLVMTSLPLARVFQCLFTFALVSASRWLAEIWQLSRRGATGELEAEFKFREVVASSPSFSRPAARAPRRACSHAGQNYSFVSHKYVSRALYQTVQTTKLKSLWKPVRLTSFQKPKFFTFSFKFVHLCLLLYSLCYLYLLLMFWAVIFVFQSFGDSPQ